MAEQPTAVPSQQAPQDQSQVKNESQKQEQDPNVEAFKEGIASLIIPHLESCSNDLNSVFAAQEKILTELKRMEAAIAKLSQFKNIPKLTQYCDRVKVCRKRVTNLASLLSTIQGRIVKMREIQRAKLPLTLVQPSNLQQQQQQQQRQQQQLPPQQQIQQPVQQTPQQQSQPSQAPQQQSQSSQVPQPDQASHPANAAESSASAESSQSSPPAESSQSSAPAESSQPSNPTQQETQPQTEQPSQHTQPEQSTPQTQQTEQAVQQQPESQTLQQTSENDQNQQS